MAWNRDRDRIRGAGPRYCAHCARLADLARDLAEATGFAARNLPQLLPNFHLERCGAHIKRKINDGVLAADRRLQRLDIFPHCRVVAVERSCMKLPPQIALQFGCALAEADSAQPTLSCRYQHSSQCSWRNRESDACARASATIFAWRHAELLRCLFIQAARRAITCVVKRGGYVIALAQSGLHALHAARRLVLTRTQTRCAFEQPLQMKRAETNPFAEFAEGHHAFGVVQELTRPRDILRLRGNLSRLATQAGSITRTLGFVGIWEEFDRLATRP